MEKRPLEVVTDSSRMGSFRSFGAEVAVVRSVMLELVVEKTLLNWMQNLVAEAEGR